MSFSLAVKNEVAKIKTFEYDEILSELAGYTHVCSYLKLKGNEIFIEYITENAALARRLFTFLKRYFHLNVSVIREKSKNLKKNIYRISLDDASSCKVLFDELDFISGENVFLTNYRPDILSTNKMIRAYIRANFLGAGSVINPNKSYHMEILCKNEDHADFLRGLLEEFGLYARVILRKEIPVLYLKKAEDISVFLSLIGGYKSLLKFENTRVVKDMRNRVNRMVNCDTANLNKTLMASYRQLADINLIDEKMGLENLSENLREVAEIRLSNVEYSLDEIGKSMRPALSKSAVNYRLKRLNKIANELRSDSFD